MKNPHALLRAADQIAAVESLRRLDDVGMLYEMDVSWDYYQVPKELLPVLGAGCSTFFVPNMSGEPVMYRNYDYRHYPRNDRSKDITNVAVVVHAHNPKAKYRSVGVSDAFWLDRSEGRMITGSLEDGVTDISALALSPYLCMDALNEAGLAVSIMALSVRADWNEIDYEEGLRRAQEPYKLHFTLETPGETPSPTAKGSSIGSVALNHADKKAWLCSKVCPAQNVPGRPNTSHTLLMRMMIDRCATVDEALALAGSFNVCCALPGSDFHVMVCDRSGRSVVLEWVGDELKVVEAACCTNYRLSYEDGFRGDDRRCECLKAGLERFPRAMPEDLGELLLRFVAQVPGQSADRSKTLFSSVYNTVKGTLRLFLFGDFSRSWSFGIDG